MIQEEELKKIKIMTKANQKIMESEDNGSKSDNYYEKMKSIMIGINQISNN